MNVIAAVDRNWGIGNRGKLLAHIPGDLAHFRQMTVGKVVVMGRKTREGIPGGILENRVNFILTRRMDYQADGAMVAHSFGELRRELARYDSKDIFVIGGSSVYRQMLEECDTAYLTKIDFAYRADAYFPNLDERAEWEVREKSGVQSYLGLEYSFLVYRYKP